MGHLSPAQGRHPSAPRTRGPRLQLAVSASIALLTVLLILPAPVYGVGQILPGSENLGDIDRRNAVLSPTANQKQMVQALHATATWNAFGTPHSLIRYDGYLASGLQGETAAQAARSWISSHKALFRLNSAAPAELELVNDSRLVDSDGHAVLFRQRFGNLTAVQDGMITVGVVGTRQAGWKVAYVSSTLAGSQAAPPAATITAKQAWVVAAHDAGMPGTAADIAKVHTDLDWTAFTVAGYGQLQRARLRALAIPGQGVRPVYEVDVMNVIGGDAKAYVTLVDARNKKVWFRQNRVDTLSADANPVKSNQAAVSDAPVTGTFSGTTGPAGACGPQHSIVIPAGTQSLDVVASSTVPADDIVLKLIDPSSTTVASADSATSPEAIHYAPGGGVAAGTWKAQVCPFASGPPFTYSGLFVAQDSAGSGAPYPPRWKYFLGNPKLNYTNPDTRTVGCWDTAPNCDRIVKNLASRSPWDFLISPNSPSFTSIGNNAKTAEAWISPLTPGENYSPPQADRKYNYDWTNQWYTSKCDTASFALPSRNDIDASIINLFVGHNRFHDFSYFLGFTEQNYNAQTSNFGNGAPGPYPGREADPELGNVQAGAVTGGAPSYQGRDNANQITLQDGVAPITNQYLFQPIAGSFYSPCADGSLDLSVYGHEYTHLISNRMAGGPDSSLTGDQAGAMGESWSDLDALEFMHAYGISYGGGANEWSLGPYATGNKTVGIRNFALNNNPLNYSDVGYDSACNNSLIPAPIEPDCAQRSEVHSDGEIWNAVNYDIRQALVAKYNGSFPESNASLQKQCADGKLPARKCPGNRRWIQIVYDAWLLMPPDVSMLGARDAYLAADLMRFQGANQKELWHAFAARGFGQTATTVDTDDPDPVAGFTSPRETNAEVRFGAVDENHHPVKAKIYVGRFEAAVTPAADTIPSTSRSDTLQMVPGTYEFIATAPGFGAIRFNWTLPTSGHHVTLHFNTNWASKTNGGAASGDGGNFPDLIDDTEVTDWAIVGAAPSVQGKSVTVDLGGNAHVVDRVQVSSMLHPIAVDDDYDNVAQNRFTALRSFNIQTCNANTSNCSLPTGWTTVGHFPDAFKAVMPRPLMPDLLIKSFDVTNTNATHVRLVVLDNQCTGGPDYAGEQDNDATNATDCTTASDKDTFVRVAELQVFSGSAVASATRDPVVVLGASAAAAAAPGTDVTVNVNYQNLGPEASSHPVLTVELPAGVNFRSAAGGGAWSAADRTVTWNLPTLAASATGSKSLVMRVKSTTEAGTTLIASATLTAPKTVANPAYAVTVVN
jgi:hypothetical protein